MKKLYTCICISYMFQDDLSVKLLLDLFKVYCFLKGALDRIFLKLAIIPNFNKTIHRVKGQLNAQASDIFSQY